jgi:toxin-antitoxin system PIN domain toxin
MKFLLDVNLLVALGHTGHVHHDRASAWLKSLRPADETLGTCAITELGFVRVSVQAGLQPDVAAARSALAKMKKSSPVKFEFHADALGIDRLPADVKRPADLTDAHLLELAKNDGASLATLDGRIPGALVVPGSEGDKPTLVR